MGRKAVSSLLVLASLVGCKTSGSGVGDQAQPVLRPSDSGQAGADQASAGPDDTSHVPPSLWSPGQRRATASYYFLAAEFMALENRDPKKTLPVFEAAYALDPNPFLGGKMLVAKAAAGQRTEALLEARRMVLLYPRNARLRAFYGDMLAQSGNLDEAIQQLEKCVSLDRLNEAAYLELTELYVNAKQPEKAIVVAKELTHNLPGSVAGWSELSRLYLKGGEYKQALMPARRAWDMQSENPQLTQIYAVALQLAGKPKQAVGIYEQLYRLDPTDEETTQHMVELYREIGNLSSALDLLDEMARQGGAAKPAVTMQKAIVLWELKRNAEAAKLLDALHKEYPEADRVTYLDAYGQERQGQMDKALALYKSVPDASSLKPESEFRMLALLKDAKRTDEAIDLGKKLVADSRAGWEAFGLVAGVYADAQRFDDALQVISDGIAKYPDKPKLVFLKGVYTEQAGDRKGCIKIMREVIKKDPANSSAYNYLGYLFAEKGENLDEAEKLVEHALKLKPNDGFYLDSLGWVHYQKGEYDKALPLLEKAVKIEPQEGVIYEHLGDVKKVKGDPKAAHELYKQALKTSLEGKDKERIEKKLEASGA